MPACCCSSISVSIVNFGTVRGDLARVIAAKERVRDLNKSSRCTAGRFHGHVSEILAKWPVR